MSIIDDQFVKLWLSDSSIQGMSLEHNTSSGTSGSDSSNT